jgi:hypothetical protein
MKGNDDSKALELVRWITNHAIDGIRPLLSAHELADQYLADHRYKSDGARVDALINWETSKNFTSGFITGLGGVLVLPVSLPAAFAASWLIQARMAAAIARIYGHDLRSPAVRTLALGALLGDSLKDIAKASGYLIGRSAVTTLANRAMPGKALLEINKRVGWRLLAHAGRRSGTTVVRGVPFVGGMLGGGFDAVACRMVGRTAKALFARRDPVESTKKAPAKKSGAAASKTSRSRKSVATKGKAAKKTTASRKAAVTRKRNASQKTATAPKPKAS